MATITFNAQRDEPDQLVLGRDLALVDTSLLSSDATQPPSTA